MAEGEAKVTLHWLNGSRSQRILWLLTELDVPYDIKVYHRTPLGQAPPELREVHPLGKSPVVTVAPADGGAPIVLAESAFIVEYLCRHWGRDKQLVPAQWRAGREGAVGGETAAWLRHQYLLSASEGTIMPYLFLFLVLSILKGPNVPFFIRPIVGLVVNKVNQALTMPNIRRNLQLIESFLATPPDAGDGTGYLCGGHLTAADILNSYPLLAARQRCGELGPWEGGSADKEFPQTFAYLARLEQEPRYRQAVDAIVALEGAYQLLPES